MKLQMTSKRLPTNEEDEDDSAEELPRRPLSALAGAIRKPGPAPRKAAPVAAPKKSTRWPTPETRRALDARIVAAFNAFRAKHGRSPSCAEVVALADVPGSTLSAQRQRVQRALAASPPAASEPPAVPIGQVAECPTPVGPGPDAPEAASQGTLVAQLEGQREAALALMLRAAARVLSFDAALKTIADRS